MKFVVARCDSAAACSHSLGVSWCLQVRDPVDRYLSAFDWRRQDKCGTSLREPVCNVRCTLLAGPPHGGQGTTIEYLVPRVAGSLCPPPNPPPPSPRPPPHVATTAAAVVLTCGWADAVPPADESDPGPLSDVDAQGQVGPTFPRSNPLRVVRAKPQLGSRRARATLCAYARARPRVLPVGIGRYDGDANKLAEKLCTQGPAAAADVRSLAYFCQQWDTATWRPACLPLLWVLLVIWPRAVMQQK